ncbi:MAG: glycine cleavage system aminomethyltransferase GcvT [Methyloprofundus sp.]|nr:glycine cleavage system aminomethyltransferase GcvT [Methyloprofundus sp.]
MPELKQTPLYNYHIALKAKMVPFAGYQMPVQYPLGIIKEHLHCRAQVGFFDISHMGQFLLSGADSISQLDKLVPTDLLNLAVGQQRYTVLTNAQGGIIDDIIITRLAESALIIVNAACKEQDFAYLQTHFGSQIQVLAENTLFALQGPAAKEVMQQLCASACQLSFMQAIETDIQDMACTISRSGYCGEDGFEISLADANAQQLAELLLSFPQVQPIGLGARDTLRLEAGLSLYGHELSVDINPVEAGLRWLIAKNKQGYPGAVQIQQQLQGGSTRKRVGLLVSGKIPVRAQTEVYTANDELVGIISSGSYAPTLGQSIALALIKSSCTDNTLYASIRHKKITLQVTTLPFVAHRYYRG